MATVKGKTADGTEVDVELPAGFIAETEVSKTHVTKEFMQSEMDRRLKGKADPDKLLEDEAFLARAREKLGLKPEKPGKPSGEDVEKLHQAWAEQHLKPVEARAQKAEQRGERLQLRDRDSKIVSAAAAVVRDSLLKSPVDGHPAPIVNLIAPYLAYSEEHDEWFVKEGDGFAYATTPTKERPYKTAAEFLGEWAKDPANADWLKDTRQRGAELGKPGAAKPGTKALKDMSVAEKVAFIAEHGQDEFNKLVYQKAG